MRLLFLTLSFSVFLLSCDKENAHEEETKPPVKTDVVKLEENTVNNPDTDTKKEEYKLGEDYFEIQTPYLTENKTQVVIYEFFGYTCSHCFNFEPFMHKWLKDKPEYTVLKRVPLKFQPSWEIYQQAYLTAETMGVVDKTHEQLFKELHENHKRFNTIEDLASWYEQESGVDKDVFLSTAKSFILDSAQRKADNMGVKMEVTGTPSLVVNGKYKVSTKIRDRDKTIKVLKFLVAKEAKKMNLVD